MKGKSSTSPRPNTSICSTTAARLVRMISGSVNSGRWLKSASLYRRRHTPAAIRPQRPWRWLALAWEIGSMGRRCILVRKL